MNARILVIEDDAVVAASLKDLLRDEGYTVTAVTRAEEGLQELERGEFATVISDLHLPGIDGLELIRRLHEPHPQLPIILITGFPDARVAIEATKHGAYEFVVKGAGVQWITELLDHVASAVTVNRLATGRGEAGAPAFPLEALIGNSRAMQQVYKEIGRLAPKTVPVLIRGEAGTGKARIARALHQHSTRAGGPYCIVPCHLLPEHLLQRELFGSEPDPLSGATAGRIGRFEQAHQGTIFLDEIVPLSWGVQRKLLAVLDERVIQRVGGNQKIPVTARLLVSTSRDLEHEVRTGRFHEELYSRLKEAVIYLPTLRERREDIPELTRQLLQRGAGLTGNKPPSLGDGALAVLQAHDWPGNLRELDGVLRQAIKAAPGATLTAENIRQALTAAQPPVPRPDQSLGAYVRDLLERAERGELTAVQEFAVEALEHELYAQMIHRTKGNQSEAARILGVSRPTVREKLQQYGLHPAPPADP